MNSLQHNAQPAAPNLAALSRTGSVFLIDFCGVIIGENSATCVAVFEVGTRQWIHAEIAPRDISTVVGVIDRAVEKSGVPSCIAIDAVVRLAHDTQRLADCCSRHGITFRIVSHLDAASRMERVFRGMRARFDSPDEAQEHIETLRSTFNARSAAAHRPSN